MIPDREECDPGRQAGLGDSHGRSWNGQLTSSNHQDEVYHENIDRK